MEEVWLEEVGRLARDVMIPGFRKGKAPRRVVERHVGRESIWRTVREMVASRASGEILRDAEPKPLAPPTFEFGDEEVEDALRQDSASSAGSASRRESEPRRESEESRERGAPLESKTEQEADLPRETPSQQEGASQLESASREKRASRREGEAMEFTMTYPLPPPSPEEIERDLMRRAGADEIEKPGAGEGPQSTATAPGDPRSVIPGSGTGKAHPTTDFDTPHESIEKDSNNNAN